MLGQFGDEFDMSKLELLREGLGQLERNTRELQESVMQIRMLPISDKYLDYGRDVERHRGEIKPRIGGPEGDGYR